MCSVLGLKCISVVARVIHALLSSTIFEGGKQGDEMVSLGLLHDSFMKLRLWMSCKMRQRGRRSQVAVERAIYSLSVVERAISVCSLLAHTTGQPQKLIT